MQPLMNSFASNSVSDATTDFNVELGYESGFTVVLFECSNSQGGGLEQTFCFNFYRVSDAFGIDERNDAGCHADGV